MLTDDCINFTVNFPNLENAITTRFLDHLINPNDDKDPEIFAQAVPDLGIDEKNQPSNSMDEYFPDGYVGNDEFLIDSALLSESAETADHLETSSSLMCDDSDSEFKLDSYVPNLEDVKNDMNQSQRNDFRREPERVKLVNTKPMSPSKKVKKQLKRSSDYQSSSSQLRTYSNGYSRIYGYVNQVGQHVRPVHLRPKSRPSEATHKRCKKSPVSRVGRSQLERLQENEKERARRKELREQISMVADQVPNRFRFQNNSQKECRLDCLQNIEKFLVHIYKILSWNEELNKLDSDLCGIPSNSA